MTSPAARFDAPRRSRATAWLATSALALAAAAVPALCQAQAQAQVASAMLSSTTSNWNSPSALAPQPLLRMGLTPNTRLVYQPPPSQPANVLPPEIAARQAPASLGLEFKSPTRDQAARSLLRVQLSGDSMLQFRPRKSGLVVTYKSQF